MSPVMRKLVAKELHVNRPFIVGASLAAMLSAAVCAFGGTAFNIGALTWLTTIIAMGVLLAIYGVSNERKEQSLLFVLSLPLSVGEYVQAKLLGLFATFVLVWLVASITAIGVVWLSDIPDGLLPYLLLLCLFLVANFSVVLCGSLHARSEAVMTSIIIVTNMGVSVFMFTVGPLPGLKDHMFGPAPVWNHTFFTVLAIELLVLVVAIALPLATAARRRDFL